MAITAHAHTTTIPKSLIWRKEVSMFLSDLNSILSVFEGYFKSLPALPATFPATPPAIEPAHEPP